MSPDLATYCAHFRTRAFSSLEYSVSDDLDTFGTMVRGDARILDAVKTFVAGTRFAGDWLSAASRSFQRIDPPASLFRVDWRDARPVAVTLYLKFQRAPTDSELSDLVASAAPLAWDGPSAAAVGEAVGLAGPTGIALRDTAAGTGQLSLYYLLESRNPPGRDTLFRLMQAAQVSCGAESILADSVTLARSCPLSVIGLDAGPASRGAPSLKFDWGEVPVLVARALISSKGASRGALTRFDGLANNLRARWLSYLALKYDSGGFAGWRSYFSTEPSRHLPVGRAPVQVRDRAPGSRMPHY
jgi:hypothetical protein